MQQCYLSALWNTSKSQPTEEINNAKICISSIFLEASRENVTLSSSNVDKKEDFNIILNITVL